jgi:hypothetical protein
VDPLNSQRDSRYADTELDSILYLHPTHRHIDFLTNTIPNGDGRHPDTQPDAHLFTYAKSDIYVYCNSYPIFHNHPNFHADIYPCSFGMHSNL